MPSAADRAGDKPNRPSMNSMKHDPSMNRMNPSMIAGDLVASESGRPFASAAGILCDDQDRPYIMLDALTVGHLTEEHPGNPYHDRVFLDTGENIGVIHSGESDRILLKVAGGTPAMGDIVAGTGFRKLGKSSVKARLLDGDGQFYKWLGGDWVVDPLP